MSNLIIAIPKGRIMKKVFGLLEKAGYQMNIDNIDRKLVVEDKLNNFSYVFVKPVDVCTYVEEGICDIGIVGNDVIKEENKDIYELYDLDIAKCKMIVAGRKGQKDISKTTLTVATKYPSIAKEYYKTKSQKIRIVKLNGSVELGPILDLSDVIVDITETGSTLKANDLEVFDEIFDISSRIVVNRASYRKKNDTITTLISNLQRGD